MKKKIRILIVLVMVLAMVSGCNQKGDVERDDSKIEEDLKKEENEVEENKMDEKSMTEENEKEELSKESTEEKNEMDVKDNKEELEEFTIEEVKEFDGKEGRKAYVVVDGIVYDVSELSKWKNGEHHSYSAGQDLTEIIKNKSPHGVKILERAKKVGKIVESK